MRVLPRLMPVVCCVVASRLLMPVETPNSDGFTPRSIAPPMEALYAAPGDLNYSYGPTGAALRALIAGDRPATASFTVTYNNFSPQARNAFQAAINVWAYTINSPVPIRIVANFTPLGPNVLGSAGATVSCQTPFGAANTLYPAALADKINGSGFCAASFGATSEITANFNSNFTDWEFNTAGIGEPGKYSFMTAVLHEVGHGLGFLGGLTSSGGVGTLGSSLPYIYDRFSISGTGTALLNIARPSAALHAQLTSNNTFWSTPSGRKLETHNMTAQYGVASDNGWLPGSSYSHLDDTVYSGTPNGLMTFQLNANESYTNVGPAVREVLTDEGWSVNATPPLRTPGDFDADTRADFAVFRPSTGQWFVQGLISPAFGVAGDIPVPGDYNGDLHTEIAVFRPSTGNWHLQQSGAVIPWGRSGDIPVPADYDGDGVTDLAVFRTSEGPGAVWYIRNIGTFSLGLRGDIPVPADYDGDGMADIAVFRPSTGVWYRTFSSTFGFSSFPYGLPGDIPVPAKFDGDNRADVAVYRPSTGTWYISQTTAAGTTAIHSFGLTGDMPLALDTSGDGVSELTLWRPSNGTWYTYNRFTTAADSFALGVVGDIPAMQCPRLPATPTSDFDGDGRSDVTVYRVAGGLSYWYQLFSRANYTTSANPQWGLNGDIKAPGDFDGDHKTDLAVFRPVNGFWYIVQSATNTVREIQFGLNGDVPVQADYDGDGRTDVAVYRPASGIWYVLTSSSNFTMHFFDQWGLSSDVPRPGDFDGDGRADFAVFRPSNGVWYLKMTTTTYSADRTFAKQFGLGTDTAVAQDFDGDGRTDLGVYRPSLGQWLAVDALSSRMPINQQLGLSTDTPDAHDYDGDGMADAAVFRPSTGQWFIRRSSNGAVQIYPWGLNGDQPVARTGHAVPRR